MREAAARAVRTLNQPPRRVQPLLVAMLRDNSASTRLAAIQGLGLLQGWTPATFTALCQARADQDPLVSSNALEVLAAPGVRTHMLPASLLEVVADTNSPFRWEAIQVLSLGGSNALPALPQLEALARGADERLRQAAAEALARISNSLHEPNPGK